MASKTLIMTQDNCTSLRILNNCKHATAQHESFQVTLVKACAKGPETSHFALLSLSDFKASLQELALSYRHQGTLVCTRGLAFHVLAKQILHLCHLRLCFMLGPFIYMFSLFCTFLLSFRLFMDRLLQPDSIDESMWL